MKSGYLELRLSVLVSPLLHVKSVSFLLVVCFSGFCGGVLEPEFASGILGPGFANARFRSVDIDKDGFYEPNQDCTWTFMGERSYIHILQLNITAIDIQPDDLCGHDFIKVYISL